MRRRVFCRRVTRKFAIHGLSFSLADWCILKPIPLLVVVCAPISGLVLPPGSRPTVNCMVLPSAEPSLPTVIAGHQRRGPVEATGATAQRVRGGRNFGAPTAAGAQPVGSFGGPGALKLPVGRVKLDITPVPRPSARAAATAGAAAASVVTAASPCPTPRWPYPARGRPFAFIPLDSGPSMPIAICGNWPSICGNWPSI